MGIEDTTFRLDVLERLGRIEAKMDWVLEDLNKLKDRQDKKKKIKDTLNKITLICSECGKSVKVPVGSPPYIRCKDHTELG